MRKSLQEVSALRSKVLHLATLQRELWEATDAYLQVNEGGVAKLAHDCNTSWGTIAKFHKDKKPLCRGSSLPLLAVIVEKPHLAASIAKASENIGDRWCGLALSTEEGIKLVFDIRYAFVQANEYIPGEQFASFFQPHDILVGQLFSANTKAVKQVEENPAIRQHIRSVLSRIKWDEVRPVLSEPVKSKIDSLNGMMGEFKKRYPNSRLQEKALSCSTRTIEKALEGKVKAETLDNLLQRMASALSADAPEHNAGGDAPTGAPEPELPPVELSEPIVPAGDRRIIRWLVSQLNSTSNLLDLLDPAAVVDGDRVHLVRFIATLCKRCGINQETIKRLKAGESITDADSNALAALQAFSRGQKI